VLLPKETNAIEHLTSSVPSFFKTQLQVRVLSLEFCDSFRARARRAGGRLESFDSRLSVKCAAAERRQLVTEVTDELVEIRKRRFQLSLFVV
jgi:hypothetical protein